MRPCRIHVSGVTATLLILLLSGASALVPLHTHAQVSASCASGNVQTSSYSQTLSGLAPNSTNTFTIPQYDFSGTGYTLISALVTSKVTTTNTLGFQNNSTTDEQFFTPTMRRTDVMKIGASMVANATVDQNLDFTDLMPTPQADGSDHIDYPPQNVYNNATIINSTIGASNPILASQFVGTGNISFSYRNTTFLNNVPTPGPGSGVTTTTQTETDDVTVYVTYSYCNPAPLAINIISFTATRENNQTVALKWTIANEEPGRRYDVEVCTDAKSFSIFGSVDSDPSNTTATYSYQYSIPAGAGGKLLFRLHQVEADGTVSYSPLRMVDLGNGGATGFSIYPNPPVDFVNLTFPMVSSGWQVDIYAANGSLVQRTFYPNTNFAHVIFSRKLTAGTYFARAVDPRTSKRFSGSFVIQ